MTTNERRKGRQVGCQYIKTKEAKNQQAEYDERQQLRWVHRIIARGCRGVDVKALETNPDLTPSTEVV